MLFSLFLQVVLKTTVFFWLLTSFFQFFHRFFSILQGFSFFTGYFQFYRVFSLILPVFLQYYRFFSVFSQIIFHINVTFIVFVGSFQDYRYLLYFYRLFSIFPQVIFKANTDCFSFHTVFSKIFYSLLTILQVVLIVFTGYFQNYGLFSVTLQVSSNNTGYFDLF